MENTDFECLVILGERRKIVRCNKTELLEKIAEVYELKCRFELQTYNADYDDWTEAQIENLESKSKIKIVLLSNDDVSDNVSEFIVSENIVVEHQSEDLDNKQKSLPRPYRLPKFAPDLEAAIQNATTVSSSVRRRIIQALFDDMFHCTMYPSSREYNDVCALLVYKYTNLADKRITPHSNLSSYESWHRSLVTKFKSERQKINNDEIVNEMRKKHAAVHKAASKLEILEKKERLSSVILSAAESEEITECHLKDIRDQCLNEVIDEDIIDDRMERTKAYRKALYAKDQPILETLEIFPCLKWHSQLIKDCQRFFSKDISLELTTFFTAERKSKVMSLLNCTKYEAKIKTIDPENSLKLHDVQNEAFLILLPLLFKEDPLELIKNNLGLLPCIVPAEDDRKLWFTNTGFYVCVEHIKICEVERFASAIEAVIAIVFLFNLQYPKGIRKTLSFLASNVCQLEEPSKQFKGQIALVANKII